jgi:hypothetical protein
MKGWRREVRRAHRLDKFRGEGRILLKLLVKPCAAPGKGGQLRKYLAAWPGTEAAEMSNPALKPQLKDGFGGDHHSSPSADVA